MACTGTGQTCVWCVCLFVALCVTLCDCAQVGAAAGAGPALRLTAREGAVATPAFVGSAPANPAANVTYYDAVASGWGWEGRGMARSEVEGG